MNGFFFTVLECDSNKVLLTFKLSCFTVGIFAAKTGIIMSAYLVLVHFFASAS